MTANQQVLAKLALLTQAVQMLDQQGHLVLDAALGTGRPRITLAASSKLAAMAADGQAAYDMIGQDAQGRFRQGMLLGWPNVHVFWMERGH